MTATEARTSVRPAPVNAMVALLAAAIFINYLDRGNLATAAPLIKDQLKLSNTQIGLLTSAFFWIYAPSQLLAAWLCQKINAYRALAAGLAIWALATLLTGLANGFAALLALRVLLGLGESAGFPASSKLLALHLPHHRLGSANALISAGLSLGPAVGTLMGGLLIAHAGWRPLFWLFGAVSLLWLVPWLMTTAAMSADASRAPPPVEPRFAELLRRRELWGAAFGHFGYNYAFYLVVSWLPLYLVKVQHYSLSRMALLGGLVFIISAPVGLLAGGFADRLMRRGASSTRVRKTFMWTAGLVGVGCMLACALGSPQVAIGGLIAFSVCHGLGSFNIYAIAQTLAGPSAAGKWMGVQNSIANIAGITAPLITGMIVDRTGSFDLAFLAAGLAMVGGTLCWCVVIRRVEPLTWKSLQPAA